MNTTQILGLLAIAYLVYKHYSSGDLGSTLLGGGAPPASGAQPPAGGGPQPPATSATCQGQVFRCPDGSTVTVTPQSPGCYISPADWQAQCPIPNPAQQQQAGVDAEALRKVLINLAVNNGQGNPPYDPQLNIFQWNYFWHMLSGKQSSADLNTNDNNRLVDAGTYIVLRVQSGTGLQGLTVTFPTERGVSGLANVIDLRRQQNASEWTM